jgi:phosphatidylinositol alpha-1,6-mannosyltransferase
LNRTSNRILLVTSEFPPGPGGIGDHAYNLSKVLLSAGYQVSVLAERRTGFKDERSPEEMNFVTFVSDKSSFKIFRYVLLLLRMLISDRSQFIIATGSRSLKLVGILQFILKRKSMAILHGHELLMGSKINRWLIRQGLMNYSHLVAVSEFSKANAALFINGKQITVIPNGIDSKKFSNSLLKVTRKWNGDSLNLLTVGRISPRKGQHNVIEALPYILKCYPKTLYHMVGIPDYLDSVLKRAKELKVENTIKIYGAVSNQELNNILSNSDLFIMLSDNMANGDVEGFGIAIIEANYFGKPAIGSSGCGIEQAIKHEYNGWLVNPKEDQQILQAINAILEEYERYSYHASDWANMHDWNKIGDRYIQIIKGLSNSVTVRG